MATLEKLRQRAGTLVAVVIGFSLLAFILGDFINSGSGLLRRKSLIVGEINGKTIMYKEFNQRVDASVKNYKRNSGVNEVDASTYSSIRAQVWNNFMNEYLFQKEYNALGLACGEDELWDMVQGRNIHPQIKAISIFQNKQTGEFDRNLVIQFLKNMENDQTGQAQAAWVEFEKQLIRDRIYTKYQNLISKGLYVTKWQVDQDFVEANRKYDIEYVSKRYLMVPDTVIRMNEEDVKKFYEEHKNEFKQKESRDISYVSFVINPSKDDRDKVEEWIYNELPEFKRIENAGQYVALNSDDPFNENYFAPSDLDPTLTDWVKKAKVGDVFGPYLVDDTWKIARVTGIKLLPDSVRASHILIRPDDNGNFDAAQATADSLLNLIKKGASFEKLAAQYGTDGTSTHGGDLKWFTQEKMIPEFSKACFFAKKGDEFTVKTSYGVHVVKVTDQSRYHKKYQVAYLDRQITPSSKTVQEVWNQASRFASTYNTGEKYDKGVVKENLNKKLASNIAPEDEMITGLENPRELIRWAFKAHEGDLSKIYQFGNQFVLAKLETVRKEGNAPLDQVRGEVESMVRNEKKADYLIAQFTDAMKEVKTLQELADRFEVDVRQSKEQYFTASSITGVGIEPKMTAAIVTTPLNTLSDPIKGINAVYVIKVTRIIEPGPKSDPIASRNRLERGYTSRVGYAVFQALKDRSKIVDRRTQFY
ncbi:MAG: SurA N-terminal domain-containing protein [Bacteroidales bacterium]|nr:SurA N-terminal domain-containing protein [Bacteroidales bacterium]